MASRKEKWIVAGATCGTILFGLAPYVQAMHITEGFLPPVWAIAWGALCLPFLMAGYSSIKKKMEIDPQNIVLLALSGAFVFVLSSLKIPSLTGSCSHPTGIGLGAVLFGPLAMSLIGLIVLLFQALLLAHGGLTTLGANLFSLGVIGPLVAYLVYRLVYHLTRRSSLAVFGAAFIGDLMTYVVTAIQLGLAHPTQGHTGPSIMKFLVVFAVTQIPLAIVEGLVSVVVYSVILKYEAPRLKKLKVLS